MDADDTSFSESLYSLQYLMSRISIGSEKYDLEINSNKIKFIVV